MCPDIKPKQTALQFRARSETTSTKGKIASAAASGLYGIDAAGFDTWSAYDMVRSTSRFGTLVAIQIGGRPMYYVSP